MTLINGFIGLFSFLARLVASDQPSLAVGRFFNPPDAPESPAPYSTNPVWTIGQVQTIKFTTVYPNYTIAIWQQNLMGGFAILGPILFQTLNSDFPQFDWSPQIYQMDLNFSNVFFLWLHAGVAADQGKADPISVTSYFFNITRDSVSSSAISSTWTGVPSSSIHSTQTTSVTTAATTTAASEHTSTSTSDPASDSESFQLSTGAKAGIGVGVSIAGLAAAVCAVLLCIRRKRKQRQGKGRDDMQGGPLNETDGKSLQLANRYPVEMDSSYSSSQLQTNRSNQDPAELY